MAFERAAAAAAVYSGNVTLHAVVHEALCELRRITRRIMITRRIISLLMDQSSSNYEFLVTVDSDSVINFLTKLSN